MARGVRKTNAGQWFRNRVNLSKGSDIASAGTLTLGDDGNFFDITGTTTVNHITTTNWRAGAIVVLQFDGVLTLTHNASSPPTGTAAVKLQGAGSLTTAAGDRVMLMYDGTDWIEVSRAIVAGIAATDIAAGAVDSAEIANGAVDLVHMSANSVDSDQYVDGSIDSAHFAAGAVDAAAIADAILTGLKAAVVADVNVVGGLPVVFRTTVASGANGDVDIVSTHKVRVIDAWAVLKGAGTGGSTLTLKNGANAISDAVDVSSGGDRDRFGVGEIDDAQHEVAAAGTIRWSKASSGGDFPGAECYVLAIRVA